MKKLWVTSLVCILFICLFGFRDNTNKYENMVNASVYIEGCGSGVFIDDNVILTAAHVLESAKSILEAYERCKLERIKQCR